MKIAEKLAGKLFAAKYRGMLHQFARNSPVFKLLITCVLIILVKESSVYGLYFIVLTRYLTLLSFNVIAMKKILKYFPRFFVPSYRNLSG